MPLCSGMPLDSSSMKMETECSSETSAIIQQKTQHNVSEDNNLHNHRNVNLKSRLSG
jgi:hypothetical protein